MRLTLWALTQYLPAGLYLDVAFPLVSPRNDNRTTKEGIHAMTSVPVRPGYDRSHAIVIGINRYVTAPPLGYAVSDAEAVADVLLRMGFAESDIHVLLDEDATRTAIH